MQTYIRMHTAATWLHVYAAVAVHYLCGCSNQFLLPPVTSVATVASDVF